MREAGSRRGPPLLLLHGGGLSGRQWLPQVERLSDYRCLVPDLPGHGESRSLGVLGLEETGAWVLELLDHSVGREPVHIVGSSFGGLIALHLLGVAPERIKTALVSGTAAGLGRGLGALAKVSAVLYALPPELLIRLSNVQFGIPKPYRQGFRDDLRYTANAAFSRKITEVMMDFRLPTAAEVPVLAAVGQRETVAAKRAARKIVASLPLAQGVLVPKVGHVWNCKRPTCSPRPSGRGRRGRRCQGS